MNIKSIKQDYTTFKNLIIPETERQGKYTTQQLKSFLNQANPNQPILINTPTGSGKTTFIIKDIIKNNISNLNILYLIHRNRNKDQLKEMEEIKEFMNHRGQGSLSIKTIQTLSYLYIKEHINILNNYDMVIIDESHSLINDEWSKETGIQYQLIEEYKGKKLFISATNDTLIKLFLMEGKTTLNNVLYIKDQHEEVKGITIFKQKDYIQKLINEVIEKDQQALIIMDNIKDIKELKSTLNNEKIIYNISKSNKEYEEITDQEEMDQVLKNERIPDNKNIIISTTSIEGGINLKGEKLQHILLYNIYEATKIKQITGRKRQQHQMDKIQLYIQEPSHFKIAGDKKAVNDKMNIIEAYRMDHTPGKQDTLNYKNLNYTHLIQTHTYNNKVYLKENKPAVYKVMEEHQEIDTIIKKGFKNYLKDLLNNNNITETAKEEAKEIIQGLMENLNKNNQAFTYKSPTYNLIVNTIDYRIRGVKKTSVKSLNTALKEEDINYEIVKTPLREGNKILYKVIKTLNKDIKELKEDIQEELKTYINKEISPGTEERQHIIKLINYLSFKNQYKSRPKLNQILKENKTGLIIEEKRKAQGRAWIIKNDY